MSQTPEEQELARLLADARVSEPMPADVAARLDATIADLARERAIAADAASDPTADAAQAAGARSAQPSAEVVPLAPRRRSLGWLAAAAAVIVVGTGTLLVQGHRHTGPDGAGSSAGSAAAPASPHASASLRAGDDATMPGAAPGSVPALHTAHFRRDATGALRGSPSARTMTQQPAATGQPGKKEAGLSCQLPAAARASGARHEPATLDGRPVTLVFGPVAKGRRVASAYSCDGSDVLAHASVPTS